MLPTDECTDDCLSASLQRRLKSHPASAVIFSSLPFLFTFLVVGIAVNRKLFPFLSGEAPRISHDSSPSVASNDFRPFQPRRTSHSRPTLRRIAAITFSTTLGLAAVLTELILCEISSSLNPAARSLALRITIITLLVLLIIVIPLLELCSTISGAGYTFRGGPRASQRFAWFVLLAGFSIWIAGFWWAGHSLPGTHVHTGHFSTATKSISEACLERIGVIGISLMALLSGFASISSPWQNFGAKVRQVSQSDIVRKQAGLEATDEMLQAKRSRLRALDRKMADTPAEGFMTRVMGSIRGNADVQERKALHMEISGLETMRFSLSTAIAVYESRLADQRRSSTPAGRFLLLVSYIFSLYCVYRILATSIATTRRWKYPETTFSGTDPINNVLALLAKHWDPSLDRLAWSRQISFLLSGVILLASFSSVLQTFHFFSRFTPSLLHHTQANLALLVSQISATYVISSALLLRSNLPQEVGSVISEALGAPLEPRFVDRWFEGWFLSAAALTATGILVGKKIGGSDEWDDDEADVEMGKRS